MSGLPFDAELAAVALAERSTSRGDCIEWTGPRLPTGYGSTRRRRAARAAA